MLTRESCERLRARGGWAEDAIRSRCAFPIGPANTYSNLAYAIVGTWLAWWYQDGAAAALAVALWLLAAGSALYHGYKTVHANRLDWLGMMSVLGALVAHGWLGAYPWASWAMLGLGALAGGGYLAQRRLHFDAVFAVGMLLAALPAYASPWTYAALGLFALAYGCHWLDRRRSPLVGVYGHAAWHGLTALAAGVLFAAQR